MQGVSRRLGKLASHAHTCVCPTKQPMQRTRPEHHKCLCCSQGTLCPAAQSNPEPYLHKIKKLPPYTRTT